MNDDPSTMRELLYGRDETDLGKFSLADIADPNEEDEPVTVVARVHDRGSPLYSEGVYEVVRTHEYDPISKQLDTPTTMSAEELADEHMPRKPRRRMAVPSLKGQYLTVKEHQPDRDSVGRTSMIPVEYVIST